MASLFKHWIGKAMTKIIIFFGLLLAQIVNASNEVYLLSEDGGEHAPYACQKKSTLPQKLSQNKEMSKSAGYLGSVQTEFADKNEAAIDAWDHYFKSSADCGKALKKINKQYSQ